jgi:hypothetical protein
LYEHPTVGWQDPEDPSAPKLFELEFVKESFLLPTKDDERNGTRKVRPMIQINYRQYLSVLEDQAAPPARAKEPTPPTTTAPVPPQEAPPSDAAMVRDLQRQVKELTDSNQELRATIKALQDKQAQVQPAQQAEATEELTKLRQEFAETKQLLAEMMLELNRLKGKSGETGKGEATPSPSR